MRIDPSTSPALELRTQALLGFQHAAFSAVLELDHAELERLVDEELAANSALVRRRYSVCVVCAGRSSSLICAECRHDATDVEPVTDGDDTRTELLHAVRHELDASHAAIAARVIDALDHAGFLTETVHAIARDLGAHDKDVELVLSTVRDVGPPGIAVATAADRILAIVRRGGTAHPPPEPLESILTDAFESFAGGDDQQVVDLVGISLDDVAASRQWLKSNVDPRISLGPGGARRTPPADVVISWADDELRVAPGPLLAVSVRSDPTFDHAAAHPDLVRRADDLIQRLTSRASTIVSVAAAAVHHQRDALRHQLPLVPLTQAGLARDLGLHESSVSRAIRGTMLQLPDRSVIELSSLFRSRELVLDALRTIIDRADGLPSDAWLADEMRAAGHPIARRTVAKYRHLLGIRTERPPVPRSSSGTGTG